MHLYRVTMSKPGAVFMVRAKDEASAARAAENQWSDWGYYSGVKAVKVEMIGFGGQYPPTSTGNYSDIAWFISAAKGSPQ